MKTFMYEIVQNLSYIFQTHKLHSGTRINNVFVLGLETSYCMLTQVK